MIKNLTSCSVFVNQNGSRDTSYCNALCRIILRPRSRDRRQPMSKPVDCTCVRVGLRILIQRHVSANCFMFSEPNGDRIFEGSSSATPAFQIGMRHRSGLRLLLRRAKPSTHGGSLVRRKHPYSRSHRVESVQAFGCVNGWGSEGVLAKSVSKFPSHACGVLFWLL